MVNSYYGTYATENKESGIPSISLDGPIKEAWESPIPQKEYHIGVLLPHLKDSYWKAANYGIIKHAKELGIKVTLYTANSYSHVKKQKKQLKTLATEINVDGIILATVSYSKMDGLVKKIQKAGTPIIELINDIFTPRIKAKALVPYFDMGFRAGQYVASDSEGEDIQIAFFPGPKDSGWASATYEGFLSAMYKHKKKDQKVKILGPTYGDTIPCIQSNLLQNAMSEYKYSEIDYIVGCAVAAEQAAKSLKNETSQENKPKIVSTYTTGNVYELLEKGIISAAPSDQTVLQCEMALDMMVKVLNGEEAGKDFPFRTGPLIPVITRKNVDKFNYQELFGEKDYTPVVHKMPTHPQNK